MIMLRDWAFSVLVRTVILSLYVNYSDPLKLLYDDMAVISELVQSTFVAINACFVYYQLAPYLFVYLPFNLVSIS